MHTMLQPAFILHRRHYRETSLLLELFTRDEGRITAVARGVRRPRVRLKASFELFTPLFVSWYGRGDLVTIKQMEINGAVLSLSSAHLLSGLYLNELLIRLLHKSDPYPTLYDYYENCLNDLCSDSLVSFHLRRFEKRLLSELGYGILPKSEAARLSFLPEQYYRFIPGQGFQKANHSFTERSIFLGKNLLAFAEEEWQFDEDLKAAKRLLHLMLVHLLCSRKIQSIEWFGSST